MIHLETRTAGLEGMAEEILKETANDTLAPMAQAGAKLVTRAREKLSVRGGPSRPGDPPAKETGDLQESVGRTAPYMRGGSVQIAWGVGVGDEARGRMREQAARLGVEEASLFKKANLHEHGGFGADGQRYPARPYIRPTEAELEAEITADLERAL